MNSNEFLCTKISSETDAATVLASNAKTRHSVLISTNDVSDAQRLEYWIDAICDVFVQLGCTTTAGKNGFEGTITQHQLSALDVSIVSATKQNVLRRARDIHRTNDDYVLVNIQTGGTGVAEQDGRIAELSPGKFVVCDSTRPFQLSFSGNFSQTIMRIRRSAVSLSDSALAKVTGSSLDARSGIGRILYDMMLNLTRDYQRFTPEMLDTISTAIIEILCCSLSNPELGTLDNDDTRLLLRRNAIKRFLWANLKDPELSVKEVAMQLGISVSNIYRAFEMEDVSISRWIGMQRLEGCKIDLADRSKTHKQISEIAFDWGFNDTAHFSRTFKKAFGVSPSAFRRTSGVSHERGDSLLLQ